MTFDFLVPYGAGHRYSAGSGDKDVPRVRDLGVGWCGWHGRIRTSDQAINSRRLYPLSYMPMWFGPVRAPWIAGINPGGLSLTGRPESGCNGWIRTSDLRVMSPARTTAPPRCIDWVEATGTDENRRPLAGQWPGAVKNPTQVTKPFSLRSGLYSVGAWEGKRRWCSRSFSS